MIQNAIQTPKRNGRKGESEFALAVKLCWFIYQFENPNNPIPLKKFCDEFEEIVNRGQILQILSDDYGICWDFYNKDDTSANLTMILQGSPGNQNINGKRNILFLNQTD